MQEVTELSVAYHAAAADLLAGVEDPRARQLLHRAIEARQRLADTEDALGRVAAGDFGRCEQCGVSIAEVAARRGARVAVLRGLRGGVRPATGCGRSPPGQGEDGDPAGRR